MDAISWIGIVGIAGTLFGTYIGARINYKSAMDAVKQEIAWNQDRLDKEKREKNEYIKNTIIMFIRREIEFNYNVLEITYSMNIPLEKKETISFYEYEKAKYKLLENPTPIVKEIIKLYELFKDMTLLRTNRADKDRVAKLDEIKKQKEILDKYFEH